MTRVLLDATAIPADRGGVGRYLEGLVGALSNGLVVVCQRRDEADFRRLAPTAHVIAVSRLFSSTPTRLIWEQLVLPRLARRARAAVIHSPHYTMPLLTNLPVVVTFHDATFFSDPSVHTRTKARFFRWWTRRSAQRAAVVIVPSRATQSELSRYVVLPDTVVAHHGVDADVFSPPTAADIRRVADLVGSDSWIAFLGTLEPRKNLPALVRAYGHLVAQSNRPLPVLALAGGAGWETDLDSAVADLPAGGRVARLGFIPTELLSGFLGGSQVTAYPSLGEGFGLPVLEAMASGAAVLTTRRLALPEVGGDAVSYCDVDDESIAAALGELLDDPGLRARLRAAARERATIFTWLTSAAAHEAAYRNACHD